MRSSVTDGDPRSDWERWHGERVTRVAEPHGPLSLTGTHWLADHPDGRLPAVPGRWRADGGAVLLSAAPEDGLSLDGAPFTGEVRLTADRVPVDRSRVACGGGGSS